MKSSLPHNAVSALWDKRRMTVVGRFQFGTVNQDVNHCFYRSAFTLVILSMAM
jgi:hypothetical protein